MINDRIEFLITALKLNPNSFAEKLGVSTTVIYNIIKGRRTKPSYDLLLKILSVYTHINTDWLLTGTGTHWINNTTVVAYPKQKLEEKIEWLIEKITADQNQNVEAVELAELSSLLLSELKERRKSNELLSEQNEQIMAILRERLGLKI